ncbi:hypothetical protein ATANTOWER_003726 [Ataeniobius toweri]|uniref:Uncharacterized protein n=1 Tax=Ataeniobius toweri TaxID=208326 RepID=A0ABU7AEW1_9TELE|nr:hypothetical protein [Ataeniobius toweri]
MKHVAAVLEHYRCSPAANERTRPKRITKTRKWSYGRRGACAVAICELHWGSSSIVRTPSYVSLTRLNARLKMVVVFFFFTLVDSYGWPCPRPISEQQFVHITYSTDFASLALLRRRYQNSRYRY